MELEPAGLAASAMRTFKGASATVSCPYFALDSGGDVPLVCLARPGRPWLLSPRELHPFELIDEQRERSIENCGVIAGRNCMAQQILRLAKLALGVGADRDSKQVSIFGEGLEARAWRCAGRNRGLRGDFD